MREVNLSIFRPYAILFPLNFMLLLGFLYLFEQKNSPLPYYLVLLVFALSFLLSTTVISQKVEKRIEILISGSILALFLTALVVLFSGGVLYLERLKEWGLETLASVVALSIISSTIIVTLSLTRGRM